ncbi:MAG: HPF/RaiA family ribosome-associated protein [Silvanigrellaceae bacterium]|nr:HPF/RaiA family ribosome-associated protein [Silvanigrellaceae bacterium]
MAIQVAAHGFELTDALRNACEHETSERLKPIANHELKVKWILSMEREQQIVHLSWFDGNLNGDVTVKSDDMYNSIHQCAKKAHEQIVKSHEKRIDQHKTMSMKQALTSSEEP